MVHPMHLVQGSDFAINVESPEIVLHGSIEESAGVILRGSVVLNCTETTKIRSISLKFQGKAKVHWSEGIGSHQHHYKEEKVIIEHDWHFLQPTRKSYHLSEGHYKWDFELPLPGDLPETVDHQMGSVYYTLKAVAERPTFSLNYTDKKKLTVTRVLLPSSLELTQSVAISNVWTDKLSYDISLPGKVFSTGATIPITFEFVPIAEDLKVRSITCSLKEYTTLSSEDHKRTEGKVLRTIKDNLSVSLDGLWTKTENLVLDHGSPHILTDSHSELIRIKHKLKFTVALVNADGHISELRAAVAIILAPISPDEDINWLPAYEDAWKSAPYDPSTLEEMVDRGQLPPSVAYTLPNAAASQAHTSIASEDSEELGDLPSLPWQGIDLSRVPSYTTAIHSRRLYSFSGSLPTYDSVSVPGSRS
ncbi:hypothetical protein J3Q64DRAFT_1769164 [Phycomyces blakesleeanus]|uniref:Arrestin C-terminal-like domain-containing protein n=1 Tax=Phycomyces blakesleeanus TaxID=4837 RepID=A0ABR3AP42_PHYBL